ncbi:MAG: putative DNA-binding domain-containing protein, partial [Gammaproteobacteria bacterium]|nr:putative DNA-binding domain-containing protein [Gammaproteobacteria bacterium]
MHNAPSLLELQQWFVDGALHGQDAPVSSWILGQGLLPESRLQIYRNLVGNNHNAALRTAYPAVLKLVGEGFFDSAASCYLRNFSFDSG